MDKEQRVKLIRRLEKELNYKRFIHTLGVAGTAAALAMRCGADMEKAELAGLLHDCAKCMSPEKMRTICIEARMPLSEPERNNPALLHSKAGRVLARMEYGVEDEEILNAIAWHTTGRPAMTLLEKIIFIADYIEPGRNAAQRLPEIRSAAFRDPDEALIMILSDTLRYLRVSGAAVDSMTQKTYDYYRSRVHAAAPYRTDGSAPEREENI
ncbi:bis(5'-nucleosyl)-tetraphosphatase (symmetrical) YqeK [Lachnoclostridium sp. Marseille-P6806]|uniref:bis(5'-nucleosyl)-tetraphosphatase (symmetrical) YqeK n=1 Tax=Lachnoclostridium sp. Marseille-P6806 TaxID=2364793 RepID=UPI00103076E1|nr:bis(5'-nucleosyl)-tetraphosphatase (symmetrical) YqeK [Lachnoclostridium sp. Marseille-P6806]